KSKREALPQNADAHELLMVLIEDADFPQLLSECLHFTDAVERLADAVRKSRPSVRLPRPGSLDTRPAHFGRQRDRRNRRQYVQRELPTGHDQKAENSHEQ